MLGVLRRPAARLIAVLGLLALAAGCGQAEPSSAEGDPSEPPRVASTVTTRESATLITATIPAPPPTTAAPSTSVPSGMPVPPPTHVTTPEEALKRQMFDQCLTIARGMGDATSYAQYQAAAVATHDCAAPYFEQGADIDAFGWDAVHPACAVAWPWDPAITERKRQQILYQSEVCAQAHIPAASAAVEQ